MHRIIKSHLSRFASSFGFDQLDPPEQFELFVNYCCVSANAAGQFDANEVTTGSDDSGIDGLAILVDDEVITSVDDAEEIFRSPRRSRDVLVVFTQSKSGESFSKSDILSFGSSVENLLREEPRIPLGEVELEFKKIFDFLIENIHKIRNGKPSCRLYFATSGDWPSSDQNLGGAISHLQSQVEGCDLFESVQVTPVDRDALLRMWTDSYEPVEAKFRVLGYTPIPSVSGVTQAYMTVVPASNFISEVLDGGDGRIRSSVFQENVRSFLGDENDVNSKIGNTLSDATTRNRFAVLNNGITIVAPEVKIASDQVHIRNFQIVNGCQTSHVLFANRDHVDDSVMIPMKVIESDDAGVVAQIVEATNSQSQIESTQFLSLRRKVREVEEYFNTFSDDPTRRIYLERRERQYAGHDIPSARIVDISTLARAYAAMFLDAPHLSSRYPKRLMVQLSDKIFRDDQKAEAYYAAAFAFYRLQSIISNRIFPGHYSKYRWHILLAIKYIVLGNSVPAATSTKMQRAALSIVDEVRKPGADKLFQICKSVFQDLGNPTRDVIKGARFGDALKQAACARAAELRDH